MSLRHHRLRPSTRSLAAPILGGALFLAAATGPAAVLAEPAADGKTTGGTLIYLEQQAHTNLYPPAGGFYPNGGILNQITDKLTYQNPDTLKIEPWIAESWTVNPERTQYTFKIRKGVTFSDGTPLDARAVALNFDVFGLGNKDRHLPVSEVINNYDHSEVIDEHTVRFYFRKPSPGFLQGTSAIGSGLVSPATLVRRFDELGDATAIIGSGPFVVARETLGKEILLTARKDYAWAPASRAHQGAPHLDAVRLIVTPEDGVRIGSLLAGQADVIRQVQAYDEKQVEDRHYRIAAPSTRGVNNSIVFRPDSPLVADVRVRQALLHATDSRGIIDTLYSRNYPQATSVLARSAAGYVDLSAKLAFDPDRARALLDDAGWRIGPDGLRHKDGQTLALAAYESPPQPQNEAMLELVAQQWARVGVKLTVLAGDAGSRTADDLDPRRTPVSPAMVGRADPDVLKSEYHPANRDVLRQKGGQSPRIQSFVDDRLNGLLEAIAAETDEKKRLALTGEAQAYILDQAYAIPVFEEPQAFAAAPYVKGLAFEAVGRPSFYDVSLDKR
ncbi:MAG: TIGR04028 family ABC transporter substrate-binding protein [Telmatospirillum sp.]|nr:TIGR04028 family ABC transporter substrate-binding protein [Telmatospirillum sp.]